VKNLRQNECYSPSEEFKMTELGPLPKEWEVSTLGELFDLQQGKALSPRSRQGISPCPFLRTANVLWGYLDLSTIDQMDFFADEAARLALQPGDLLVCEGGDIGRTAIWRGELSTCYYQNHIHRLRKKMDNVFPQYYMYWMQAALLLLNLYIGEGNRTTIPNLSGGRLKSFVVPRPPLPEQKKIAAVLAAVQEAKEKTDTFIKVTKELKRSIMKHMFTYGLVPLEETEKVSLRETEIGLLPAEWETRRLIDVVDQNSDIVGGPFGSNLKVSDYKESGIPIIRLQNIERNRFIDKDIKFISKEKAEELKYHSFRAGDIVLAKLGDPIGKTCIVPKHLTEGIVVADVVRIRTNPKLASKDYIVYALNTYFCEEQFRKGKTGTTRPRVNVSNVRHLKIPLPSINEQVGIANILLALDKKIDAEENKKKTLEDLFKTLLGNLMTGKIRVVQPEVSA
jgi:type I restriction enzyme S subunit